MAISRERIEKFNVVTDVLDKILREEDIKRLQAELSIQQQDGSSTQTREQQLEEIAKYIRSKK